MELNINDLVEEIRLAITMVIKKDFSKIKGFQENQAIALATHAKLIAEGVRSKDIDPELKEFYITGLKAMAKNFVKVTIATIKISIEKVLNAVMEVLIGAIQKVIIGIIPK